MPVVKTPLILSIETATRSGSVAVTRGDRLLAEHAGDAAISHSSHLLDYIGDALSKAGVTLDDVEIFAVAAGPGSFTGLRIGLATIKSFAATLERACTGVPTLYAVARAAGESKRTLALLPAGRGEVFAQLLKVSAGGEVQPIDAPAHLSPQKLLEHVSGAPGLVWAGEGAHVYAELIKTKALAEGIKFREENGEDENVERGEGEWTLARRTTHLAKEVAGLALISARADAIGTPEQLSAIYVRPSDAELHEQSRD